MFLLIEMKSRLEESVLAFGLYTARILLSDGSWVFNVKVKGDWLRTQVPFETLDFQMKPKYPKWEIITSVAGN